MANEKDCENFLRDLMVHVNEMIDTYERDNNIMLVFDMELDLSYDRTMSFKVKQNGEV